MKSRQVKIEKKRKKRAKQLAVKEAQSQVRATSQMFPKVVYKNDGAAPWFFSAVQEATREMIRNHPRLLGKDRTELFHRAKEVGFPCVFHMLARSEGKRLSESIAGPQSLLYLGDLIMARVQDATGDRFFPSQDFALHPGEPNPRSILVSCRGLKKLKTKGGTAYFSPWKPTVTLNGRKRLVAFSRHAIERVCDRAVVGWRTYGGWGDVFGVLYDCVHFEPYPALGNNIGFSLFFPCCRPFFAHAYGQQILGYLNPRKTYYYRVGYCPVVCEETVARAKTLLVPGMRGTPEHVVLRDMADNHEQLLELERRVGKQTLKDLAESWDFSLIRKFHDSGFPQVVALDHEVLRNGSIPSTGV